MYFLQFQKQKKMLRIHVPHEPSGSQIYSSLFIKPQVFWFVLIRKKLIAL